MALANVSYAGLPPMAEDCFFLNIWQPSGGAPAPEGGWPVFFWCGISFFAGSIM
jgi:carboxylesterase type B